MKCHVSFVTSTIGYLIRIVARYTYDTRSYAKGLVSIYCIAKVDNVALVVSVCQC